MPAKRIEQDSAISIRPPRSADGAAVHALIARCPPLDTNSLYCNLLQCAHFGATSALAEAEGDAVGFVSGYSPPPHPDALFVWQVAVDERARGHGLAKRLIMDILQRPDNGHLRYIRTTITAENTASWAMFRGLARKLGAPTADHVLFDRDEHFGGEHDSEHELIIGPFQGPFEIS
ncbi:MAG: diaminobutyrate acetyltransferase [Gammaproteobacteria bacterium]|jgi:L-2,4-diaminobutyric acid acetyltransferase|nr:diaminobutyrate acetyltransferase [Gammaproteobacteria bacterium]